MLIIDGTLSWVVNGYFSWVIWTWAELEAEELRLMRSEATAYDRVLALQQSAQLSQTRRTAAKQAEVAQQEMELKKFFTTTWCNVS